MKRVNQKAYWFLTFAGAAALMAACAAPAAAPAAGAAAAAPAAAPASGDAAAGTTKTLTAIKVDAVSADPAAAFWANAPVVKSATVATEKDEPNGPDVNVQAAYDGKTMALRIEWADTTDSFDQKMWEWDGAKFTRLKGLGDRMGVLFPIENNAKFATKGCAAACHNNDADVKKWNMSSDTAELHYDLWQWTSASTNPIGQAQDESIGMLKDPEEVESATAGDKLDKGGNLSNVNKAKDGPIYMSGADINARYIISGEQVALDTTKLTKGALIPGSILSPWVGSRGDITAKGVWKDGKWAVVLMRALDTGHADDLIMTPPKSYPLGIAVFDHRDLEEHTTTSDVLVLEWK